MRTEKDEVIQDVAHVRHCQLVGKYTLKGLRKSLKNIARDPAAHWQVAIKMEWALPGETQVFMVIRMDWHYSKVIVEVGLCYERTRA